MRTAKTLAEMPAMSLHHRLRGMHLATLAPITTPTNEQRMRRIVSFMFASLTARSCKRHGPLVLCLTGGKV